jgi:dephospho-CoA kinase
LVEAEMSQLSNYNTILLSVDEITQEKRLLGRNLNREQIKRRLASQYDFADKKHRLEKEIADNQQGQLWILENQAASDQQVENLLQNILDYFKISIQ